MPVPHSWKERERRKINNFFIFVFRLEVPYLEVLPGINFCIVFASITSWKVNIANIMGVIIWRDIIDSDMRIIGYGHSELASNVIFSPICNFELLLKIPYCFVWKWLLTPDCSYWLAAKWRNLEWGALRNFESAVSYMRLTYGYLIRVVYYMYQIALGSAE